MTNETDYTHVLEEEAALDDLREQLAESGRDLANTRTTLNTTMNRCADIARRSYAAGIKELHIAQLVGVNRRTVRKWLGKPDTRNT